MPEGFELGVACTTIVIIGVVVLGLLVSWFSVHDRKEDQ